MNTKPALMRHRAAIRAAFPYTIPILTGYLFLGTAYGILLRSAGYSLLWALGTSTFIFAGSMQFVSVSLLALGVSPLYAFFVTLMVNARHIFYGISTLEHYRGTGRYKPYLIFGLTDETFSVVCSTDPPETVDRTLFYFYITLLNQIYWITGSLIGSLAGSLLHTVDSTGFGFVLTALFVVIFLNQWHESKNHLPALIGVAATALCLILFGSEQFLLPAMALILLAATLLQGPMGKGEPL